MCWSYSGFLGVMNLSQFFLEEQQYLSCMKILCHWNAEIIKKVFVRNVYGTCLHCQVWKVKSVVKILRCTDFCLLEKQQKKKTYQSRRAVYSTQCTTCLKSINRLSNSLCLETQEKQYLNTVYFLSLFQSCRKQCLQWIGTSHASQRNLTELFLSIKMALHIYS